MSRKQERTKHKTTHEAETNDNEKVAVFCLYCQWREEVDVKGLSWVGAMEKIYAARDTHEKSPDKTIPLN